ncbi:hypothetical protein G3R49_08640 [Shewanella sp. WXL01]|uniref:Uncharacterized protein n=1 Tax=Shewanella maritima TaxID=2520507 RepID=A0A411PCQ9_9GAMM|nr:MULTISPECIES: hypothetical protein [Shewanella]NKF50637.1 hypothetical protein [Shewanella sp. WXL01]QBF81377.1 hypothetical protein EXU30_00690 [Shewanella maritima]
MKPQAEELLKKHDKLIHSEGLTVESHTQREQGEWFIQTLMLKGYQVPFKYKRTKKYKSLAGQKVSLVYYPAVEQVAGFEVEVMQVVRIRRY